MAIVSLPEYQKEISLGISACLMGQKVRYNGDHKKSSYCTNLLSQYFDFVTVCPEVGIGMSIPRKPIRLVGDIHHYRVKGTDDPTLDVTDQLYDYGKQKATELDTISGYILMQKSPSCGMERVKVYHENGSPLGRSEPGMFAKALMETRPLLPVEEEGRLHDPVLRENFINRVVAYHHWHQDVLQDLSYKKIGDFHARYKYQLMAHDQKEYAELGQLVAKGKNIPMEQMAADYFEQFMTLMKKKANRKSNTNVLLHILGYLKKSITSADKQQLLKQIESYRSGYIPLIVPLTVLKHFVDVYGSEYIQNQYYLEPHPEAMGLRNNL
ncbi:hypothetical protein GZ77_03030 [Endozoicomonas montiporae]|uniref:DUF1722 domain-containing protein n=2 Tax=Endozoicomonas montiporae TaxID=1027273 RepID=A0A081NAX4_9GAMM|nr:DUF523 and DUF1722 domain-containing protein [Endozoicomonas montiporae]AMO56702.1 IS4 family transposase [Endozoicomonas montiporae CL-33]KEQ15597.1 hypothetical protein GZ77_03030 [Endozoicomonas montiporae]